MGSCACVRAFVMAGGCGVQGVHGHGVCVRVCLHNMGRMSLVSVSVEGCSRKIGGITRVLEVVCVKFGPSENFP